MHMEEKGIFNNEIYDKGVSYEHGQKNFCRKEKRLRC